MTTDMSRRGVLALGMGAAAAVALVGCKGFGGAAAGAGSKSLSVAWKGDPTRATATNAIIDQFKAQHSGLTITTEYQSGNEYGDKLSVRIASGNPPDVFIVLRPNLRDYGNRAALLDLGGTGLHTDQMNARGLDSGRTNGKLVAIPAGMASYSWILNPKTFEKYGVAVPDMKSWSWQDYAATAAEVTKASGGKVYGSDFPLTDPLSLGIWLRQNGADLWNQDGQVAFTQDHMAAWFQTWVDLHNQGAIPAGGAIENLGQAAEQSPIARGLVASQMIPSNSFTAFNKTIGGSLALGFFPGESNSQRRGMQLFPSLYWSVAAATKDKDNAVTLLDFMVNDVKANETIGLSYGMPVNQQVSQAMADQLGGDDKVFAQHILDLGKLPLTAFIPDPAGSAAFGTALATSGDKVRFGKETPAAAAAEFMTAAKAALKATS